MSDERSTDDECAASETNVDAQLAELRLLTRSDHHAGLVREAPSLTLELDETPVREDVEDEQENEEIAIGSTGGSSFTALLAASRRMAGAHPSSPSLSSPSPDSPRHAAPTEARTRRPTTMPTLCEEDSDDAAVEEGPESDSCGDTEHAEDSRIDIDTDKPRTRAPSSSLAFISEEDVDNTEDQDHEKDTKPNDPAFEEMVQQLPYDISFLVLSVGDLSVRNLLRVRDALARTRTEPQQLEPVDGTKPPLDSMRLARTMMAVSTLRLFLLRYDEEEVLLAVTIAVRRIFKQYVHDHGVIPMANAHGVLTSNNITRVVLLVRDTLQKQQQMRDQQSHGCQANDNNKSDQHTSPGRPRRSAAVSPAKSDGGSSWLSRRSSASPSPSPAKMFSPSRSSAAASPARSSASGGVSSSSYSSPRRSILASEGNHVLMNEKIAAFQHRPDADRLPSFKVRRESAGSVEEAARRRQRSIDYGNESTRLLRKDGSI